jgi:hypothetical protein
MTFELGENNTDATIQLFKENRVGVKQVFEALDCSSSELHIWQGES